MAISVMSQHWHSDAGWNLDTDSKTVLLSAE